MHRLRENAEAAQTVVVEVKNLREAADYAVELTGRRGKSSIAAPGICKEGISRVEERCRESGLELPAGNLRDRIGRIGTTFIFADWGIAQPAALVVDSRSEDVRIATMLSETHVVVLPISRILPDLQTLERELARVPTAGREAFAVISAVSGAADIRGMRPLGNNGTRELHIVLVDDEAAEGDA